MDAIFYCDESGNTGTNWIDADQPFFVYGGWLIPAQSEKAILAGLDEIFGTQSGNEIKAKRFFKRTKAYEEFKMLFDLMLHNNAFPIFIILDKAYIVAPKIIETFFDPAYNQTLAAGITADIDLKKGLAEIIMDKPLISDFARLIRQGEYSLDEMEDLRKALSKQFSAMPNISKSIDNINDEGILDMLSEFHSSNTDRTLTVPGLTFLMQVVQVFCEKFDMRSTIILDNIRGYDNWLDSLAEIFLSPGERQILKYKSYEFHSKYPNITNLKLMDSKVEIFIQISDLLCGFISKAFRKTADEVALNKAEKEILEHLLVLHDDYYTWDYVMPNKQIAKYLKAIGVDVHFQDTVDYHALDFAFSQYLKI